MKIDPGSMESCIPPDLQKGAACVWLNVSGQSVLMARNHFPATWLTSETALRQAGILVRVAAPDFSSLDMYSLEELQRSSSAGSFMFIVPRLGHAKNSVSYGPEIGSFACPTHLLHEFLGSYPYLSGEAIPYVDSVLPQFVDVNIYELSRYLLDFNKTIPALRCLQLPFSRSPRVDLAEEINAGWVIPHSGVLHYLNTCLASLRDVASSADAVSVGLDEIFTDSHREVAVQNQSARFFECTQSAGYAFHIDRLWRSCPFEYTFFQSSECLSLVGRRGAMAQAMQTRNLDIVGGHEIHIDDFHGCVRAHIFPVEGDSKELIPAYKPIVNISSSLMNRTALRKTGGVSSLYRFGSDIEFVYRAIAVGVRVGCVNDYTVVRRIGRRVTSMNPASAQEAQTLRTLMKIWAADLGRWFADKMTLDQASFCLKHREDLEKISLNPVI